MPVLTFKGKTAVENHHHTVPHRVLELDEQRSVLGKGEKPSLDGNLIIEGDNLLALKALLPTHAGRVKCIYIDPPYNTGNEGWIYNDNLTQPQFKEWIGQVVGKEGEDATRHDKWCCIMYPRLQLLRELLSDDGAIFVTVDDTEIHHLRCLMDEVFGVENFLANFVWQSKDTPGNNSTGIAETHNPVVLYRKSDTFKGNLLERNEEQIANYANPDNDERGLWLATPLTRAEHRDRDYYEIANKTGRKVFPPKGSSWRRPPPKMKALANDNRIWWGKDRDADFPMEKDRLAMRVLGAAAAREQGKSGRMAEARIRFCRSGFQIPGDRPRRLSRRQLEGRATEASPGLTGTS